ncbi:glycosyltransferase family 9 protein [Pelosinus propionicus]|uniref:Heptosyltransferase-3 n=1 Tax=Pelosinus propionicus DSM 13327 TaxID=1123291 RepID=A0A1I4MQC7_9FIRM|nr:glycosyltransferase family 9 protein [Pelosinus propionicus]SFM05459.1 heptosyltransferase-3 [Pelosinus propionicus DSM 13327]
MTIDHAAIHKILYINLAFIGDLVLSTPTVRALRNKYPDAVIDMLVVPWSAQVVGGNPYADHVYIYDKKGIHRSIKNLWHLIFSLRSQKYDLVIAANFAVRGAMLAKAIGARYRVGYDAQHAGIFLTHTVSSKRTSVKHETENQLEVLKPLDINTTDFSLAYRHNPVDVESMQKKVSLSSERPIVVICPFGRHPLNSWKIEGYIDVLRSLSAIANCYLIGGKAEAEKLEEINQESGGCVQVLAGTLTINELAAFLALSNLVITVDTGPMHIASAVGVPILALFGRSDSRVWGPRAARDRILKMDLECVPCIVPRECQHHRCMRELKSDVVTATALDMLENK